MIDLEKMFEEIEGRARKMNGLRYGIRVFLSASLLFFGLAILHFSKILTLDLPSQLLYTALPITLSSLAYLIAEKRNPNLHKFTYGMDKKLNTGGKLSSLYQLKEKGKEKTLSNLLAKKFIRESPNWKKAFQLPFSVYFVGSSAGVVFFVSILLMFLPQPKAGVNKSKMSEKLVTENEIIPEGETTIEKLKTPDTSNKKGTSQEKGGNPPLSSIPEKKGTSNQEEVTEGGKPGESTDEKISKLPGKDSPSSGKNIKAKERTPTKKTNASPEDIPLESPKNEGSEIVRKSTGAKSLKAVENSAKRSVETENGSTEESSSKGEKETVPRNSAQGTKGKESRNATTKNGAKLKEPAGGEKGSEVPKKGREGEPAVEKGIKGGVEESEGFPRIEKGEKGRRSWQAGSAKRGSDSKETEGRPQEEPGFSTRDVFGEIEKVSPLPKFLDKGHPIKKENGVSGDLSRTPGQIEEIRSVVDSRELDSRYVSIIKDYFASIREGGK